LKDEKSVQAQSRRQRESHTCYTGAGLKQIQIKEFSEPQMC
jgi:hypothetical protein